MPINFSSKIPTKNGLLSVVKLTIPHTGEVLNIGVIMKDTTTNEIKTKIVEDMSKVKKCFQINDTENIKYALEILQKRQIKSDTIYSGEISSSIIITEPSEYMIIKDTIEEGILDAFYAKVSIAKHVKERKFNELSKTSMITTIKNEIKTLDLDHTIKTRKHLPMQFGEAKEISMVSFANNNPIVATQLISLYVDFWDTFQNALSLKYTKSDSISDKVLYMPIQQKNASISDKAKFVREQAMKEGLSLIDTQDPKEIIGFMKHKADLALAS